MTEKEAEAGAVSKLTLIVKTSSLYIRLSFSSDCHSQVKFPTKSPHQCY